MRSLLVSLCTYTFLNILSLERNIKAIKIHSFNIKTRNILFKMNAYIFKIKYTYIIQNKINIKNYLKYLTRRYT